MIQSLVLIEGQNVSNESLESVSLENAKQMVVGDASGFGVILHIAVSNVDTADDPVFLNKALCKFAKVSGVAGVITLALRTTEVQ